MFVVCETEGWTSEKTFKTSYKESPYDHKPNEKVEERSIRDSLEHCLEDPRPNNLLFSREIVEVRINHHPDLKFGARQSGADTM